MNSGLRHRIPVHIQQHDRRDARRFERALDLLPVADDHDREVVGVDVPVRDPRQILLRHRADVARIVLIVVLRQILEIDVADRAVHGPH